jgi:hypothetical protein
MKRLLLLALLIAFMGLGCASTASLEAPSPTVLDCENSQASYIVGP